jgi:hypothetical protein
MIKIVKFLILETIPIKSTNTSRFEEKPEKPEITQSNKEKESITTLVNLETAKDELLLTKEEPKAPFKEPVKEPLNYAKIILGNWAQFSM